MSSPRVPDGLEIPINAAERRPGREWSSATRRRMSWHSYVSADKKRTTDYDAPTPEAMRGHAHQPPSPRSPSAGADPYFTWRGKMKSKIRPVTQWRRSDRTRSQPQCLA
jgi:hypothetical protein